MLCQWIINWKPFDYLIFFAILANCAVMALEVHDSNGDKNALSRTLVATIHCALN